MEDQNRETAQPSGALTNAQEAVIVAINRNLLLPLNDLVALAQEFVAPDISLGAVANCLKKHKEAETAPPQVAVDTQQYQFETFKSYDMGFMHINVDQLPGPTDSADERFLFVATDLATRWSYCEITDSKTPEFACEFLYRLGKAVPFKISRVATENSPTFTNTLNGQKSSGEHKFQEACKRLDIQHVLTRKMGSRIDGSIAIDQWRQAIQQGKHFLPDETLQSILTRYQTLYNEQVPQNGLGQITPVAAIASWQKAESRTMRTKKAFKLSGLQLLLIWVVWIAVALFFASRAMQ